MDDAKLAELYQHYGYLMYRRGVALLGNAQDADDAVQEAFLRVRRHTGEVPKEARAWLYAIVQNCCWDLLKKRRREEPLQNAVIPEDQHPMTGTMADADRRALLSVVLRKLDRRTRDIGVLHFLGGLTQEEVAATTHLSRKTVGRKLHLFEVLFRQHWLTGGRP